MTETQEQIQFFKIAEEALPEDMFRLLWASSSGLRTTPKQGAIMKRMGGKRGIPDIGFMWPVDGYHGLQIELKRLHPRRGVASDEQKEMVAMLNAAGYYATFCYGAKEALEVLSNYMKGNIR